MLFRVSTLSWMIPAYLNREISPADFSISPKSNALYLSVMNFIIPVRTSSVTFSCAASDKNAKAGRYTSHPASVKIFAQSIFFPIALDSFNLSYMDLSTEITESIILPNGSDVSSTLYPRAFISAMKALAFDSSLSEKMKSIALSALLEYAFT